MARVDVEDRRFDTPKGTRRSAPFRGSGDNDRFGRFTEWVARGMGTPGFLVGLSVFAITWMAWNTFAPENLRFDSILIGFTALTLVLSLQASYAAPLILLAQNRQDDRDRVQIEQDRQRAAAQPRRHRVPGPGGRGAAARGEGSRLEGLHPRRAPRHARGARPARGGGAGACRTLTPRHSSRGSAPRSRA